MIVNVAVTMTVPVPALGNVNVASIFTIAVTAIVFCADCEHDDCEF